MPTPQEPAAVDEPRPARPRRLARLAIRAVVPLAIGLGLGLWTRVVHTLATTEAPRQALAWFGPDGEPVHPLEFEPSLVGVVTEDTCWFLLERRCQRGEHHLDFGSFWADRLWIARCNLREGRIDVRWPLLGATPISALARLSPPAGYRDLGQNGLLVATLRGTLAQNHVPAFDVHPHPEDTDIFRLSLDGGVTRFPKLPGRLLAMVAVADRIEAVAAIDQHRAHRAWAPLAGGEWHLTELEPLPSNLLVDLRHGAASHRATSTSDAPGVAWTLWAPALPRTSGPEPADDLAIWRLTPGGNWARWQALEPEPSARARLMEVGLARAAFGGLNRSALPLNHRLELYGDTWMRPYPPAGNQGRSWGTAFRMVDLRTVHPAPGPTAHEATAPGPTPTPAVAQVAPMPEGFSLDDPRGGRWQVRPNPDRTAGDWVHLDADHQRDDVTSTWARLGLWHARLLDVRQWNPAANFVSGPEGLDLHRTDLNRQPVVLGLAAVVHLALAGLPALLRLLNRRRRLRIAATLAWATLVAWQFEWIWQVTGPTWL